MAGCQGEGANPEGGTRVFTIAEEMAHVVWAERGEEETIIYYRSKRAGSDTLSEPVRVSSNRRAATHDQAPPQVAIGPDGTLYVAYLVQTEIEGRRFPASSIELVRSTDGGQSFEPAASPHEDVGFPTSHHFFDLAVGPDEAVYVAWLDGRARDAARRETVSAGSGGSGQHHDEESDLPGTEVRLARSEDQGRSFLPSVRIAMNSCECCRTSVAFAGRDTVYVAWRNIFGDQIRDMAFARSTDGGRSFEAEERLYPDNWRIEGCPHAGPQVSLASDRHLRAAWYTGKEERSGLYTLERGSGEEDGEAWPLIEEQPVSLVSMSGPAAGGNWIGWENARARTIHLGRWPAGQAAPEESTIFSAPGRFPWVDARGQHVALTWEGEGGVFLWTEHITPE